MPNSDELLVIRCQEGDKSAFELLFKKYQRRIYHLIYRITQDPGAVEPLAQEVFLKAYRAIHSFRRNSQFYTWLYRIAVNTSLSYVKRDTPEESREQHPLDIGTLSAQEGVTAATAGTPEQEVMRKEFYEHVLDAVRQLPEELRVAIVLREFVGLNYEEIAEVIQIPLGTVRSRIFRGRARLRESLASYVQLEQQ
ncbi:MAG: sigma-70 family RNA polymerase sigma factor [bacterium]